MPEKSDVLDLCSSWISHLPSQLELGRVAGLGMNEAELSRNERLTERMVQDLNTAPSLPYEDESFDFVCNGTPRDARSLESRSGRRIHSPFRAPLHQWYQSTT
eukprot:1870602-Prymnesium_polylepis.1